ncbi:Hypothetical predicted protein [Olea europaea subsp. europaea]|uniref:Uncharacterized protein n=1 Tax=Olea europaea subsp. europaea TaxID=158383 RepID=A0A8S0SEP0_OLEEU|nr:Hypothetical predicted protein [Olea europaea subsp. europaea]
MRRENKLRAGCERTASESANPIGAIRTRSTDRTTRLQRPRGPKRAFKGPVIDSERVLAAIIVCLPGGGPKLTMAVDSPVVVAQRESKPSNAKNEAGACPRRAFEISRPARSGRFDASKIVRNLARSAFRRLLLNCAFLMNETRPPARLSATNLDLLQVFEGAEETKWRSSRKDAQQIELPTGWREHVARARVAPDEVDDRSDWHIPRIPRPRVLAPFFDLSPCQATLGTRGRSIVVVRPRQGRNARQATDVGEECKLMLCNGRGAFASRPVWFPIGDRVSSRGKCAEHVPTRTRPG